MQITLQGDVDLLCTALEFAAENYVANALICRADGHERIAEQFERQASQAGDLLARAYEIRDA